MAKHEHTAVKDPREAIVEWCDARRADIGQMTGTPPDDFDTADVAVIWDALDQLNAELYDWFHDWAVELADRIDGRTIDTPIGPLTTPKPTVYRKWNGAGIIDALTHQMIDPNTGDYVDVVRVDTLRLVVPGITPDKVSSKWLLRGLPKVLGNRWDRFVLEETSSRPKPRRVP